MKPHLQTGLLGVVTCSTLIAVGALGAVAQHGRAAAHRPPKGPYVALGDSYTAGPEIPGQTGLPAGCRRSDRDYPALVAKALKLKAADFRDMSCSGATIADLTGPQSTADGVNRAQLSALSGRTRLVTVGIGGNDVGFTSLISGCVKEGMLSNALADAFTGQVSQDAPCRRRHVTAGGDDVRQRIDAAGERLSGALDEVRRRAPHARVYVVGYPAILPSGDGGTGYARRMGLASGDAAYLREKERELNAVLRQRATAAGAGYVDTYTPSAGRDACSAAESRWIEPLIPAAPAAAVHPNERGERGMADAVLRTVREP